MKIYSLALLFAFAAAQETEETTTTETTEAETTEEEAVKTLGGALTWDPSGVVAGEGTFEASVTYMEDADGMVAVESSANGTWGSVWLDKNNKTYNAYEGGIILAFRQNVDVTMEDGSTSNEVRQEGWWAVGTRSGKDNAGVVDAAFQQNNFPGDFTYETFTWNGVPTTDSGLTEPNWTDGTVSMDHNGASGSANRAGQGSNTAFKDGEEVTVWGGVWCSNDKDAAVGGAWGAATMTWDLEKPAPKPKEEVEEVVEDSASSLAMTALAGAALAALAF